MEAAAVAAVLAVASLLLATDRPVEAAGPTTLGRTPWQVLAPATYVAPVPDYGSHGAVAYYAHAPAIPPANDPGWAACGPTSPLRSSPYSSTNPLCPNSSTIGMTVGSRLPGCMTSADFTFFQTLVDIPAGTTLNSFTIAMSGMDDGARITVFNSLNIGGLVVPASYVFLGGSGTSNLAPYVVAGETNRVVITQVDDCRYANNLQSAVVNLNGTVVPPVPVDLAVSASAPASAVVGSNIAYNVMATNSGASITGGTLTVALPTNVTIAPTPGCVHNGVNPGGTLTCAIPPMASGATLPWTINVTAQTAGVASAQFNVALLAGVVDSQPANNAATASTTITAATPPPFSQPGTVPVPGTCLCLPPYMLRDLSPQDWWVRAAGSGPLVITGKGFGVNPAEAGTLTFRLYDPSNALLATETVVQPASGEVSTPLMVAGAPVAGALYRVNVSVASVPSTPVARHYRIEAQNATLLGTNSPTPSQAEHEPAKWLVAVAPGETSGVIVVPGVEAGATGGSIEIFDATGALRETLALGVTSTAAASASDAGLWTVAVHVDGHYAVARTAGTDRGVYVDWRTWGEGSATLTINQFGGAPNTTPLLVELVDALTGAVVASQPGATSSANFPKVPAGEYRVRIASEGIDLAFFVTCTRNTGMVIGLPNRPPVAVDDAATTNEDAAVTIAVLTNDSDANGGTLSVTGVTPGTKGTATINGDGTITYTPNANANGTDTFTYTISDGQGGTATATVIVTIVPMPDAPVAQPDSATTNEDTAVTIDVIANDSDADGDALTVTAVTQGANGTVVIVGNQTQYTPAVNWSGTDTFTYTVTDGTSSVTATVTVTVTPVNDPPVAVNDAATAETGWPVSVPVLANDTDVDGGPLSVIAVTQGANGTVTINGDGTVTYTSTLGFVGTDTFTYTVSDGNGGTATATVTVTVRGVLGASRMTGGGSIDSGKGKDATRATWGFEIRCDASQGNFQYQDHSGGNFHLTALTSVVCFNDPAIGSGVPQAGFDTMRFSGTGRWNGTAGYTVEAVIVDAGEPGRNDRITITVKTGAGVVVSSLTGSLTGGNHQAHK